MPAAQAPARQPHSFQPQPWRDRRIEIILGNLLRTGVLISAAVVLLGASIYLSRHAHEPADYRVFRGEPSEYRSIRGVIQSVISGRGRGRGQGLIQLGLLLLIATPIARVAFSVAGFAIERDRLYVAFTLLVLAILLYSFLGSGIGV
jgi:uncharacterized membrane protein